MLQFSLFLFLLLCVSSQTTMTASPLLRIAPTLNRILLLLNDPLCHPSFLASHSLRLPPKTMLGAVGCQDPQCTLQNRN